MDVMKEAQTRAAPPQWGEERKAVHDFDEKFSLPDTSRLSNNARSSKVLSELRAGFNDEIGPLLDGAAANQGHIN
jgi:hypothetical protein